MLKVAASTSRNHLSATPSPTSQPMLLFWHFPCARCGDCRRARCRSVKSRSSSCLEVCKFGPSLAWGYADAMGSVVFTAIYRFTTLFQFEPSDITCTLTFTRNQSFPIQLSRELNLCHAVGTLATAQIWCVVESAAGIISACLPTLGPLVQIGIRKFGITTGLTWGSQQKTPASGASDLQTIGGSGAPKKVVKVTDTFDDTPMTKSKGSRAFQRLSEYSGNSDEHVGWVNKSELKSSVRAHDVEKDRGESDEIPLHNIVIRTDVEWQESQSRK